MAESSDAQLQLKKRARRRLVGAVAFAGLAAVVLPMVMDEEPKQQVQDIQIRIPGQDATVFSPKPPAAKVPAMAVPELEKAAAPVKADPAVVMLPAKPSEVPMAKQPEKLPVAKPAEKVPEKAADKKSEKPAEKSPEKTAKPSAGDAQRAAAILGGKVQDSATAVAGGQHVILIGAFANPANVKQLQHKIGDLGVKTYTEPLDSPQGKKTRLRAGPFPTREAADKALDRMKRIGVSGVVAAK